MPTTIEIKQHTLTHITICDPAKTVKLQSADSAIVTVGVDRSSRRLFVRECSSGKYYPDELYNEIFRQVILRKTFLLGIDTIGLSNFVMQPLENECRIRGAHPLLVELPAKRSKEERIATLAPLFKQGYIYFPTGGLCNKLEQQLLSFPRSKLWDLMDAMAYIIYIMDKYAIYFDPSDEGDQQVLDKEDFESLTNQPMMDSRQMGLIV